MLTETLNLSMGITHSSDRHASAQLLQILKLNHETYDPSAVRIWAVQHGWSPEDPDQLKDVAGKILEGRGLKGAGEPFWDRTIIHQWRKAAIAAKGTERT